MKPDTETSAFKDDACIYINSETKQFCIPAYEASSENGDVLLYASDDDSLLTYKAPIRGTTKTNTDVSETVKLKFYNGGKDQMQLSSTTKDGQTYDFWKLGKVNYGDFIFFGKGSSFHLEKNERASGFAFSILGEGYRLRIEQFDRKDPELKGVGSKCKIDFSKDGITYTNTDTQKIALSYIFTYDEGNYNFTPVSRSTMLLKSHQIKTVTVSKQDTGFAITGGGEVYVQTMPLIAHKEQDAFDGSYEEYLDWLGSYFINLFDRKMFCCNSILKRNAANWYTTLMVTAYSTMLLCSAIQTEMESRMNQVTFIGPCYILLIKQLHLTVQEDTIKAMFQY